MQSPHFDEISIGPIDASESGPIIYRNHAIGTLCQRWVVTFSASTTAAECCLAAATVGEAMQQARLVAIGYILRDCESD